MSTPTSMHGTAQGSPAASRSWASRKPAAPSRISSGGGRRRRVPYLVLGVLLVVVCATGYVITVLQVGDRESVPTLARPVNVGHVLAQDLRQVPMSADSGTNAAPASQASSVLGQPVAYSLPAGTLPSRSTLGNPQIPPTPATGSVRRTSRQPFVTRTIGQWGPPADHISGRQANGQSVRHGAPDVALMRNLAMPH